MLNMLRRKKTMKRIMWGLAIVIIPAFVLWGAGSMSKKSFPYKYVGTIDGLEITPEDFIKSVEEVQVALFLDYFNQPEALRRIRNDRALLNRLAWENLIVKETAKKADISVSDEELVNFVTSHPLFLRGGVFDDRAYKYILRNSLGMLPRAFEENARGSFIVAKYKGGIVKDITVSDDKLREDYRQGSEKSKLYYVVIDETDRENAREKAQSIYENGAEKGLSLKKRLRKESRRKKIGAEADLELRETDLISRSGYIEGVGEANELVDKAFQLEVGQVSEPIETRRGFALIEPIEFELMDEEEFEKEKEAYRARALAVKRAEAFAAWLDKAKTQTSLNIDLDKI